MSDDTPKPELAPKAPRKRKRDRSKNRVANVRTSPKRGPRTDAEIMKRFASLELMQAVDEATRVFLGKLVEYAKADKLSALELIALAKAMPGVVTTHNAIVPTVEEPAKAEGAKGA